MLVTDDGDEMCWWQLWNVGDSFKTMVAESPWKSIFGTKPRNESNLVTICECDQTEENSCEPSIGDSDFGDWILMLVLDANVKR